MFGMTFWQFWCVVVIILSVLWIALLKSEGLVELETRYYSFTDAKCQIIADKFEKFKHRNDKNIVHHKKKKKK